ncbi:hypothetical protein CBR_g31258 [Chara braunii]|uniref:Sfi1 spindle body domain-containing protein n=1 Tax=Chara braunii TaxID=69332 RepID=A0A388JY01_CHABU|nr:hypothetical protein CBR_g31258 [Chara braunii]|eukprot:GBG62622.1 hypothetical protein CBR_g31258 [Chara braunii]
MKESNRRLAVRHRYLHRLSACMHNWQAFVRKRYKKHAREDAGSAAYDCRLKKRSFRGWRDGVPLLKEKQAQREWAMNWQESRCRRLVLIGWAEEAERRALRKAKLKCAQDHWEKKTAGACLSVWARWAAAKKDKKLEEAKKVVEARKELGALRAKHAFASWIEYCRARSVKRYKDASAQGHWVAKVQKTVLQGWNERVANKRVRAAMDAHAVAAYERYLTGRAWAAWRRTNRMCTAKRRLRLMADCRWRMKVQARGLRGWRWWLGTRREKRRRTDDAMNAYKGRLRRWAAARLIQVGLRRHAIRVQAAVERQALMSAAELARVAPYAQRWRYIVRKRKNERLGNGGGANDEAAALRVADHHQMALWGLASSSSKTEMPVTSTLKTSKGKAGHHLVPFLQDHPRLGLSPPAGDRITGSIMNGMRILESAHLFSFPRLRQPPRRPAFLLQSSCSAGPKQSHACNPDSTQVTGTSLSSSTTFATSVPQPSHAQAGALPSSLAPSASSSSSALLSSSPLALQHVVPTPGKSPLVNCKGRQDMQSKEDRGQHDQHGTLFQSDNDFRRRNTTIHNVQPLLHMSILRAGSLKTDERGCRSACDTDPCFAVATTTTAQSTPCAPDNTLRQSSATTLSDPLMIAQEIGWMEAVLRAYSTLQKELNRSRADLANELNQSRAELATHVSRSSSAPNAGRGEHDEEGATNPIRVWQLQQKILALEQRQAVQFPMVKGVALRIQQMRGLACGK